MRSRRRGNLITVGLLLGLLAGGSARPAEAAKKSKDKVIIVLDVSGSMAGKIGEQRKIDIARQAIRELLGSWSPAVDLGLVAYGHRRKGDCSDIELVYPVGRADAPQVMRAIDGLRPRGRTPLGAAVRLAAERLDFIRDKATVILVSDGKETCNTDPCRLGKDLEARGVDFTTHVIGFDVKRDEEAGLKCLAGRTGGKFLRAGDARGLALALGQTVRAVEAVKPGVKLVALVNKGGPEWEGDVAWYVLPREAGADGKRKPIVEKWRARSGHIFRGLPAGRYVARLVLPDYRYIVRETKIEVTPGRARRYSVVLDVGRVRLQAKLGSTSKPLAWDLAWEVFPAGAKRRKLTSFWRVKHHRDIWLSAGRWRIEGTLPDAKHVRTEKQIEVTAGSFGTHPFVLDAGLVRLEVTVDGKPHARDVAFDIYPATGGNKKVVEYWRVRSGKQTVLGVGRYRVKGLLPDSTTTTGEQSLEVKAGDEKRLILDLHAR